VGCCEKRSARLFRGLERPLAMILRSGRLDEEQTKQKGCEHPEHKRYGEFARKILIESDFPLHMILHLSF
jgi:hypothetical protein